MAKQQNTGVIVSASAGQPATFDEAGYGALTFTDVGEVLSVGEFGSTVAEIQSQPLATGVTEFFAGFIEYGQAALGLERDASDAGQQILSDHTDGANKREPFSVKVTLPDGEVIYLDVRCFSYTTNIGAANSMIGSAANLRVNKKPVLVAAP